MISVDEFTRRHDLLPFRLDLQQLQPEGKKIMAAREFINGYHPAAGERLVLTKEA